MGARRRLPRAARSRAPAVHHLDAAAEHHRARAPRARLDVHAAGPDGALPPHAGRERRLDSGPRPCRDRDRVGGRARTRARGPDPRRVGPREVSGTRVGVAREVRRRDQRRVPALGLRPRLGARAVHDGRGALRGRRRGVRAPAPRGLDLSRNAADQLGHRLALDGLRRGDRVRRTRRPFVAYPLRERGRRARGRGGDDAARDDARRHGGGGAPRRRALPRADRQDARAAAGGAPRSGRRRRGRRARIRDRRGQGDAGPRSDRLRHRFAPRPRDADGHRFRRQDDRRGRPLRRARPLRSPGRGRARSRGGGRAREDRTVPPTRSR